MWNSLGNRINGAGSAAGGVLLSLQTEWVRAGAVMAIGGIALSHAHKNNNTRWACWPGSREQRKYHSQTSVSMLILWNYVVNYFVKSYVDVGLCGEVQEQNLSTGSCSSPAILEWIDTKIWDIWALVSFLTQTHCWSVFICLHGRCVFQINCSIRTVSHDETLTSVGHLSVPCNFATSNPISKIITGH